MLRKEGGYCYSVGPLGVQDEASTFTCNHCNCIVKIKPQSNLDDLGGMCRNCMKMICPKCVGLGCHPFEKKLEAIEARDRALRSYGW